MHSQNVILKLGRAFQRYTILLNSVQDSSDASKLLRFTVSVEFSIDSGRFI